MNGDFSTLSRANTEEWANAADLYDENSSNATPTGGESIPLLGQAVGAKYGSAVANSIKEQREACNAQSVDLSSATPTAASTKSENIKELNQNDNWTKENTFSADISKIHPEVRTIETTLKPASQNAALNKIYSGDGIHGVCSKDKANVTHSINLWSDTFVVAGKKLFSCVRSGVLAAMKLAGVDRQNAFDARLNENITMVLEEKYGSIGESLTEDLGSKRHPIEIDLLDIGLLSNHHCCGVGSEHEMKQEQFRMLDTANGNARQVQYGDKVIWVKPRIHAINIGVQRGDGLFATSEDIERTRTTTENICSKASEYLSKRPGSQLDRVEQLIIKELVTQCKTLANNKTYLYENDGDYYALPARLALLADKIGIQPPMIHCKSGKDRTARLIEEVKLLALRIEINKQRPGSDENKSLVPKSGALDGQGKELLVAIAMNSGNQKIQELNTGVIGNKQGWQFGKRLGVYGLAGLAPDKRLRDFYKKYTGGSSNVAV